RGTWGTQRLRGALRGARLRLGQELAVALERREHGVDVRTRVVAVRGDTQVAVPLRGDDSLATENGDELIRISGLDAQQCPASLGCARRDHRRSEVVQTREQVGV